MIFMNCIGVDGHAVFPFIFSLAGCHVDWLPATFSPLPVAITPAMLVL
jgi:hypothetical protein